MWVWRWQPAKQSYGFQLLECPNRLDQILVRTHLSPSGAEATRLIKQGSVRFRRSELEDWQSSKEPRMPLPVGKPWVVRVGKSPIRLIPREGRDGWDCLSSAAELMFPEPYQGLRSWEDIMLRDTVGWKSHLLDRLEKSWNEITRWFVANNSENATRGF